MEVPTSNPRVKGSKRRPEGEGLAALVHGDVVKEARLLTATVAVSYAYAYGLTLTKRGRKRAVGRFEVTLA